MRYIKYVLLLLILLFSPVVSYAQTEISADPYALTPEKLKMFQGYQGDENTSNSSLFNGDNQKLNGLFTTPGMQLGGAAPLDAPTRTNDDTAQYLLLTSHHDDMVFTYVAGIPYNKLWDTAGAYKRYAAWENEMESYGIPHPDSDRIALAWTKNWCTNPNASPKPAPTSVEQCGFDFTDVDVQEGAGPYNDQCQTWGVDYFPDWSTHGGSGRAINCTPPAPATPIPKRVGMGEPTQCGTTHVNAPQLGGVRRSPGDTLSCKANDPPFTWDQPPEGWKVPMKLTVKNIGSVKVDQINLKADLQDHNGLVATDKAPTPPYPNPAFDASSDLTGGLVWSKVKGQDFTLIPNQSQDFVWAIYPLKPNSVLRWTFTAEYHAGESILLHWIPVHYPPPKNPYPDLTPPTAGGPVGGGVTPAACLGGTKPNDLQGAIKSTFGITMNGFNADYLGYTWDEFCSVSWSKFFSNLQGITIQERPGTSEETGACASGGPSVYLDQYSPSEFYKFIIIHELGHVIGACSSAGQQAQTANNNSRAQEGPVSWYGANAIAYWGPNGGVTDNNEDFADSIAYYLNPWSTFYTLGPKPGYNTNYPDPNPFYPSSGSTSRPIHLNAMQQLLGSKQ